MGAWSTTCISSKSSDRKNPSSRGIISSCVPRFPPSRHSGRSLVVPAPKLTNEMRPMLKSVLMLSALMLALPMASDAANLRELAGCKPDVDAPVVSREGLFTVHMVCDRLLFEIPDSLYDRDILLSTEFAAISGGSDFIAPGTLVSNQVVHLNRRGTKVNIEGMKYDIVSERGPGIERAVEATTLPTLLGTFDILGRGTKGEAIVDLTPMFVTEPAKGFALGFMKYFGTKEIDAKNSYIESVKTFPRNIGVRYYQTWVADNTDLMKRIEEGEESVVGSMGFVFYTNIYLLPDKPMRPRFWDSRIGYFSTSFQDYGSGE